MRLKAGLMLSACLGIWAVGGPGPVNAQEAPTDFSGPKSRGVSPEATKVLTPQSDGMGRLMPLHAASVLEWLCGDSNVQTQLGVDQKACYVQMRPGVAKCTAEFQGNLPVGRLKVAATGKPDIVAFRRQLHNCLQQDYVARQAAVGKLIAEPTATAVDPVAAAMGAP